MRRGEKPAPAAERLFGSETDSNRANERHELTQIPAPTGMRFGHEQAANAALSCVGVYGLLRNADPGGKRIGELLRCMIAAREEHRHVRVEFADAS